MSLQSVVGNFANNAMNTAQDILGTAKAKLSNIFGSVKTGFSNIWGGGFAGIDENGLETLKGAIETFCAGIEGTVNEFNQDSNIDQAYKGLVRDAASDYVAGVKVLLSAYVSTLRKQKEEATTYFTNWKEAASNLSSQIATDASTIRTQAQEIRVD